MKNQIIKLMFALTVAFTIFSCSNDGNNEPIAKLPTIAETVTADAQFSVLLKGLTATNLATTFATAGSYTVFAPTNTAFAAYNSTLFPTGINDATFATTITTAQRTELSRILQYHILSIGTLSGDLLAAEYSKTFAGGVTTAANGSLSLFVGKVGSDVLVNGGVTNGGAKVTAADLNASNGVIHTIDSVLKLPTLVTTVIANPKLSTLLSIVTSTTGTFGDQSAVLTALSIPATTTAANARTVYAPTNNAFTTATTGSGFITGAAVTAANVTKILQYHVENGNRLTNTAGTSFSTSADITVTSLLTPQTFLIQKSLLKLKETSTTAVASSIVNINIQATNGVIHIIDRVLQPTL